MRNPCDSGDLCDLTPSLRQLARLLGISATHTTRLAQKGVLKHGATLAEQLQAYCRYLSDGVTSGEAGLRRQKLEADIALRRQRHEAGALELRKLSGELIERAAGEYVIRDMGTTVRATLDVFPDQVAPLVAPLVDLNEVHAVLVSECNRVLTEISEHLRRGAETLEPDA